jgi:hypothetical protein
VTPAGKSLKAYRKATAEMISETSGIKACSFDLILDSLRSISEVCLVLKGLGKNKSDIQLIKISVCIAMQQKAFDLPKSVPIYPRFNFLIKITH